MFDKFKPIFQSFNNLNLLTLMENLRLGRVFRKDWRSEYHRELCPISHGMPFYSNKMCVSYASKYLGNYEIISDFVLFWDYDYGNADDKSLLTCLESIWKERLDDAEAVQLLLCSKRSKQEVLESNVLVEA